MAPRRSASRRKPARRTSAVPPPPAPPVAAPGERVWLLDVPYELRAVAQANGATWNAAVRSMVHVGASLPPGLELFTAPLFSWQQWQQDDLSGTVTDLPGDGSITPRPHQEEAADLIRAAHAVGRPGVLIGDDVGLGKTISTLSAITDLDDVRTVLIVCPVSVVAHWRRTIQSMGTHGKRFCVINYDRLKHLLTVPKSAQTAKRTRTKNKRIATEGKSLVDWDVVVFDESHKLKNPSAQRSHAARTIAKNAFCVWLSATAGTTPLDLAYLAPLLGEVTGHPVTDLNEFEAWCAAQGIGVTRGNFGRWEWTENEADLDLMARLLYDGPLPAGIRRVPEDIAGWPPINRILHPIALDRHARALYDDAWTEFRRAMSLEQRGKNPTSGLAAQTRFRQKASLLRVPGVTELVCDLLDNGRQVAVSTVWLETLDALADQLEDRNIPVAVIHGNQTPSERETERIRFQTGDATVCIFTVEEGISLHAGEAATNATTVPRATVVADPRYGALGSLQVEGRAHRDGQRADAWYCYAVDTVEEKIVTRVVERMRHTKQLAGDDTASLREIEAILHDAATSDTRAA